MRQDDRRVLRLQADYAAQVMRLGVLALEQIRDLAGADEGEHIDHA